MKFYSDFLTSDEMDILLQAKEYENHVIKELVKLARKYALRYRSAQEFTDSLNGEHLQALARKLGAIPGDSVLDIIIEAAEKYVEVLEGDIPRDYD